MSEKLYGMEGWETVFSTVEDAVNQATDYEPELYEHWPITLDIYRPCVVSDNTKKVYASRILEELIEWIDEDYGDPDGDETTPTETMQSAAMRFVDCVVNDYKVFRCEPTGETVTVTKENIG